MARDLGRDLDIGMPREETQNVNVSVSAVIDKVSDNVVKAVLENADGVIQQLKNNRRVAEFTLGEEVEED